MSGLCRRSKCSGISSPTQNSPVYIPKNIPLAGYLGASLHWYAYAIYTQPAVPELSLPEATTTTGIIDFYINPFASSTQYTYTSLSTGETSSTLASSTTNCQFLASSASSSALIQFFDPLDLIGAIQSGACNALSFSFIPNSSEQADLSYRFNNLGDTIKTKPPVGYFSLAIADMQSFALASSSTSTILDTTSTEAVYGVFEPLDAGVASIIGFMLLLWYFNRGRHLEI